MSSVRQARREAAVELAPGDDHYMAYVGPPAQYDLMGAMQFRLLVTLGLRATHRVLDFGCGSLRAGRLFIPYLDPGCYFGVEPNDWLVEEAIEHQLGREIVRLKGASFASNDDFSVPFGTVRFDYILAQSIFSHAGPQLVHRALLAFRDALSPQGIVAATFAMSRDGTSFAGEGWVYPGCVRYTEDNVLQAFAAAGLHAMAIPFFHPRQQWFLAAADAANLPSPALMQHLRGAVLKVPEFAASIRL